MEQYKKAAVRIRKAFDEQYKVFAKNPLDLGLRNHPLKGTWKGHRKYRYHSRLACGIC